MIEFVKQVEEAYFRTVSDTGANANALFIWTLVRARAGLPALRTTDLPYWDEGKKQYVMPIHSKLAKNLVLDVIPASPLALTPAQADAVKEAEAALRDEANKLARNYDKRFENQFPEEICTAVLERLTRLRAVAATLCSLLPENHVES